jgi:pyruvate,water dikinase
MAVVVQEMVSSDASGVLFTTDPVEERSDRIRIEVSRQSGGVVSGSVTGDRLQVNRISLEVIDRQAKCDLVAAESLERLCHLALEVERHFGRPQDIEFALSRGQVYLLQARPITALRKAVPETLPPLGEPSFLDKLMKPIADERYVVAPRPLDNLVYTRAVGGAIYMLKQSGGVVTPEDEAAFRTQIWRQAYRFPPIHRMGRILLSSLTDPFRLLETDWQTWWESGPRKAVHAASEPVDLSKLQDIELLARADRILADWEDPINERFNAARAIQVESWLKLLITLAVGRKDRDRIFGNLMTGMSHQTVDLNEELWELSRQARRSPAVLAAVVALEPESLKTMPEGRLLLEAFNQFIEKYGHREGSCWYLSTPTWRQKPMQVWRLLSSLAQVTIRTGNPKDDKGRFLAARDRVERRLRFYPGLKRFFRWMVDGLRRLHSFRESSHLDLSIPLDALQAIAHEWGKRLMDRDLLEIIDDVFYLTHDEVKDWLTGQHPSREGTRELVARRRATYLVANARWQAERFQESADNDELKGIAVSPGVVTARVRIVRGEHQFDRLRPGEVLVCPHTNPAWTPLFTSAAAIVTETGGAASHAAIVAREYGIPAVMGVRGVTQTLEDGQEILVDGDQGILNLGNRSKP